MQENTIDYVVPMVFHDDLEWRANFKKLGSRYDENDKCSFVRYRSWGTEHLLVKCIRKNLPFVRNVYVVLAQESQKRQWMDDEDITVVYHADFIPERFLPTFNSRTIEMFLKDIPGISEYFIYGNDDMFPLRELRREDFFVADLPCLHHTEKKFPDNFNGFHIAAKNGLNFIARQFGKHYSNTWLVSGHSLTPMVKSTWEYLWKNNSAEMEYSISPFREVKNFNQWLCPWWHFFSCKYVDHSPKRKYVSVRKTIDEVVAAIRNTDIQVLCINDNECEDNYMAYGDAVKKEIELLLN